MPVQTGACHLILSSISLGTAICGGLTSAWSNVGCKKFFRAISELTLKENKWLRSCFSTSDQSACVLYVHKCCFSSHQVIMEEGAASGILSSNAMVGKIWNARCWEVTRLQTNVKRLMLSHRGSSRIFQKSLHVHQVPYYHLTDSSSKSIARQKFNCKFSNLFASSMANVVHTVLIELHCREHHSA